MVLGQLLKLKDLKLMFFNLCFYLIYIYLKFLASSTLYSIAAFFPLQELSSSKNVVKSCIFACVFSPFLYLVLIHSMDQNSGH